MANHVTALKRIRITERRTHFNRIARTRLRNQIRSMRKALTAKEFSGLQAIFSTTVSVIDKAAQKGYIKRGTAARYKSRIHKKVKTALGQLQVA